MVSFGAPDHEQLFLPFEIGQGRPVHGGPYQGLVLSRYFRHLLRLPLEALLEQRVQDLHQLLLYPDQPNHLEQRVQELHQLLLYLGHLEQQGPVYPDQLERQGLLNLDHLDRQGLKHFLSRARISFEPATFALEQSFHEGVGFRAYVSLSTPEMLHSMFGLLVSQFFLVGNHPGKLLAT